MIPETTEINKQKHFQIRPRFQVETFQSPKELDFIFASKINQPDAPFDGKFTEGFVSFYPKEADHHYWSPHLSITIEPLDHGSLLRGHYGPSPAVWTMFVFLYAVIGLSAVICTVIGFANRSLGLSGSILWLVPLLLFAFSSLYYTSHIGQKKGHDQKEALHRFLESCIGKEIA